MDDWDQDKLEDVVKQKHGTEKPNRTSIVCKYFLDAVEKKMYGWWVAHPPKTGVDVAAHCFLFQQMRSFQMAGLGFH